MDNFNTIFFSIKFIQGKWHLTMCCATFQRAILIRGTIVDSTEMLKTSRQHGDEQYIVPLPFQNVHDLRRQLPLVLDNPPEGFTWNWSQCCFILPSV